MEKRNLEDIKKLLIVVDMVNGFVREGAMASSNIEHIVSQVERLVKNFDEADDNQVAFIRDTHEEDAKEFMRYPIHCLKETKESENIDELKKYEKMALIYEKNSTSAIFSSGLLDVIDEMKNLQEVVIVGCCTDICVINLAIPLQCYFDEKNRNIDIVIPKDAVETYDSESHNAEEWNTMAFRFMEASGIKLVKEYGGNRR